MPLTSEQRLALRNKRHPTADERLFAPMNAALRQFMRPGAAVLDAGAGPGTLDRRPLNVIEHLPNPSAVFREYARLLVPGGELLFKTPGLTNPTIVASRLLPFAWHQRIKRRLIGGDEDGVFPTYYRCNTPASLERALRDAGLQRQTLVTVDQTYDYLHFSALTYNLGLLYSRLTTAPGLGWLGNAIIGVYTRPDALSTPAAPSSGRPA